MKVSKQVIDIQNRIKKMTYHPMNWVIVSVEYYEYQKNWYVFPLTQENNSEYVTYLANPFPDIDSNIVEGKGKTLASAIKNLQSVLDRVEKQNYKLYILQ